MPGGTRELDDQPHGGGLAVGSSDGDDRNRGTQDARCGPGLNPVQTMRCIGQRALHRSATVERDLQQRCQLAGKCFSVRPGPAPDGEMGRRCIRQGAREVHGKAGDEPPSLIAVRHTRAGNRREAGPFGQRLDPLVRHGKPGGHRQRQLDRRPGEIQVGPVEHP